MGRIVLFLLFAAALFGQPRRVLYLTHSAGFRHDCIPASAEILRQVTAGRLDFTWSEDAAAITAESLRNYDAVLFYTSGELPFSDSQKRALLDFVSRGGGFAGVHSATDTLYGWAEYGELIGGYFDGHPWVQEVRIDIEDPAHPAVAHLGAGFRIVDEIYQFRNLSRDRVRPLMTLDAASVDLTKDGVQRGTTDFPLAWTRMQGSGRVFYTALGHFEETWRDPRFQEMMLRALLWVTGQTGGEGAARRGTDQLTFTAGDTGNAASLQPLGIVSPNALISIFGRGLTPGSSSASSGPSYATKLAGATVLVNDRPIPLLFASPTQINAMFPANTSGTAVVTVRGPSVSATREIVVAAATPGIFAVTQAGRTLTVWATGLGVQPTIAVTVGGAGARVLFAGMSTEFPGLQQVNVELPNSAGAGRAAVELRVAGSEHFARYEAVLQ